MRFEDDHIQVSASDLAKHLACRHATSLDLMAARGEIERIYRDDPALAVLVERGLRHEAAYLSHLKDRGYDVVKGSGADQTREAMRSGIGAIAQAELQHGRWRGRADILLRVDKPSGLGSWSYDVVDTKLARETRGGTILQLCLYSELVSEIQGKMPEHMHVISPGRGFEPESFRLRDFLAYHRLVKSRIEDVVTAGLAPVSYPEPVEHCDVCSWWIACNHRRRKDDHLSFVAGISRLQIDELRERNILTLANLAAMPLPMTEKPQRGSIETYVRVREQSRLQLEYRDSGKAVYELLPFEAERGLLRLPAPSAGDIFLDFESDPFVEESGLEYLLGYVTVNDGAESVYTPKWALDRTGERHAFESFVDFVIGRQVEYPDLHIYHFSPYEPAALKRLMGRYATREDELDRMLRAGLFVDLYSVVKQSLRASVERYSLKDLEIFFGFKRQTDLRDARKSLRALECALELDDVAGIPPGARNTVEAYNREDCISTLLLRNWLETLRPAGDRPPLEPGDPSEQVDERSRRARALMARLLHEVSDDRAQRTDHEQARWLLAHMLEFHRREEKAPWWEYFRLRDLSDDELFEERSAISGLQFVERVGGKDKYPIHRYRFPQQETQLRKRDPLHSGKEKVGSVEDIDIAAGTLDIHKTGAAAELHPTSVFAHKVVTAPQQADALFRIGTWVVAHGVDEKGAYRAARDLLLHLRPRVKAGAPAQLYDTNADVVAEASRIALQLDQSALPIQGPPGSGKTYTGARMICALLRDGKKVGITAVSHKVIRKLLEEVLEAAKVAGITVRCLERVPAKSKPQNPLIPETTDNDAVVEALESGEAQLVAGTAWLWAREEMSGSVDVLFVDEAGQMSLPDVLAVSQAAKSVVLLGDPQQLEQPLQGTHPPGVDVSALQHVLGVEKTMPAESGLFLGETWRLAPSICRFTSELFYEGRLLPHAGLELQRLTGPTRFAGSGLWFVPVDHDGNQNSSNEEALAVTRIVADLLKPGVSWINVKGEEHPLTMDDILIVSPYNAQVFNLAEHITSAHIGTVDKFQGQQAPVVIYSMASSSPEDAPRGMEFLYSMNRFNVATSRARCVVILVASPRLFEPECQSPHQMKLANVLCRFLEMAVRISAG